MSQSKMNKDLYIKEFLDIPKFFKCCLRMRRGDLYRECGSIVKNYERDWNSTYDKNSYKDIQHFKNLLNSLGIKNDMPKIDKYERRRKFEPHMFGMNSTVDSANKAFQSADLCFKNVMSHLDTLAIKTNNVVDQLSRFLEQTTAYISSSSFYSRIIIYLIKIIAFGYMISQEHNRSLTNILALLSLIIPTGVGISVIQSLGRAVQGIIGYFVKNQKVGLVVENENYIEPHAGGDQFESLIEAFFSVTKYIFVGCFKNISPEEFKNVSLSMQKVRVISDYIRSSTTIFDCLIKLFEKCIGVLGDKIFKIYGVLPSLVKADTISPLIDRYMVIKQNNQEALAPTNSHIARSIVSLYEDCLKEQQRLLKVTTKYVDYGQMKLLAYLGVMIKHLESVINRIPEHVKGTKNARRIKPYWIYIFGEPRIGKTSLLQPYLVNILAQSCKIIDHYEDYSAYTYFRNCGDKYWEAYNGQPFLWYNDLFQTHTSEETVNQGIMELTNVVDDNIYALNMAFERKQSVYFDSQFVISNCQLDIFDKSFIANRCLSGGSHLYARRNLTLRFRLNPEYKDPSGVGYNKKMVKDILESGSRPCLDGLFPQDMYIVDLMCNTTGQYIKSYSFMDAIKMVIERAKADRYAQTEFKEKLYKHFEKMWDPAFNLYPQAGEQFFDVEEYIFTCKECEKLFQDVKNQNMDVDLKRDFYDVIISNCTHIIGSKYSPKWKDFCLKFRQVVSDVKGKISDFLNSNTGRILSEILQISLFTSTAVLVTSIAVKTFMPSKVVSHSAESNVNVKKMKYNRVRIGNHDKNIEVQAFDQQNTDIEQKLRRNFATLALQVVKPDKEVVYMGMLGTVLGVGGDIFCMPKHYWIRMMDLNKVYKENNIKLEVKLQFLKNTAITLCFSLLKLLPMDYAHLGDVVFVQFQKVVCLPKIAKYFAYSHDEPVLFESYLYGIRSTASDVMSSITVQNVRMDSEKYRQTAKKEPILNSMLSETEFVLPVSYRYTSSTIKGDCSMVLMNTDPKMNARKCLGIHVAGTGDGFIGISNPIFQEDIEEVYNHPLLTQVVVHCAELNLLFGDSKSKLAPYLNDTFNVLGKAVYKDKLVKMTIPSKTKIQKSVVFDIMEQDFGPHKMEPARLAPFKIGESVISPMAKGLDKLKASTRIPSLHVIESICLDMYQAIGTWVSPYVGKMRVLTLDEALNGIGHLNKMDLTTSPGFPYILEGKGNGKREWFDVINNQIVAKEIFLENLRKRLEKAKQGEIIETYFVDTLKDEPRLLSKVEEGKTRIFQVGPMCLSVLMRQYFGMFISHCHATSVNGEMAIGINPNSIDWTLMIKNLLLINNKFLNGDYSKFDASAAQVVLMSITEHVINKLYNDASEEDNLVRCVLMATFLNNVHIVEDLVFELHQGNMSGIVLTTIVNCLFNMFLLRLAYYDSFGSLYGFVNNVKAKFYGDDNLVSVAEDILPIFNMLSYKDIMAFYGLEYTTADKVSDMKLFYTLDQCSFLKRNFLYDDYYNIYLAQLEFDVINEIPRWSESDPYNVRDQVNRFNAVLIEMVNYGEEMFMKYFKIFQKYIVLFVTYGFNVDGMQLLTFNYIRSLMYPHIFPKQIYDLTDGVLNSNVVHKFGGFVESKSKGKDLDVNALLNFDNSITEPQSSENNINVKKIQVQRVKVTQAFEEDNINNNFNYQEFFKIAFENKIEPQSSDGILQVRDENAGQTVTQAQITTTFDDTIPHQTVRGEIPYPIEDNPYLDVDLPSFIKREWYLSSVEWTTIADRSVLTNVIQLPNAFYSYLATKLRNIAYWAPDIELIFKINGTPMHYGRMMFAVVPFADYLDSAYLQPQNFSQHRFIQISPTGNQSVRLQVPFLHFRDRMPVNNANIEAIKYWTLYMWPVIPLQVASLASEPPSVTIAIYGRIVNPRFSGYTHIYGRAVEPQSNEQEILSKQENTTSQIGESGRFPISVSNVAKQVSVLAADMSRLANDVGFGTSANVTSTKPIIVRQPLMSKVEDLPATNILGASLTGTQKVSDELANAIKDGMLITKVAGRMCLLQVVKIDSSVVTNTEVFSFKLDPLQMLYKDYALVTPAKCTFPLPAAYLTRLCRFWRGSMRFHFSIVASPFHSMRLRMSFTPNTGDTYVAPNAGNAAYNVNQVWDINNQTDYSFTIPFHYFQDFVRVGNDVGRLSVVAMTKLSSVLATPNPIYMQVWASMCDDFQLAYPEIPKLYEEVVPHTVPPTYNGDPICGVIGNPDVAPWSDNVEPHSDDSVLNAGNPLLNYKSLQFPAMSVDALEGISYPTIGDKKDLIKVYRVQTSYEITSCKELVNLLTPIERTTVKYTGSTTPSTVISHEYTSRAMYPRGRLLAPPNDSQWYNFWSQMMALFRFNRGGIRLVAFTSFGSSGSCALLTPRNNHDKQFWDVTAKLRPFYALDHEADLTAGSHLFRNLELEPFDVTVPYFSEAKCSPTLVGTSDAPYTNSTALTMCIRNVVQIGTTKGDAVDYITWCTSGGDDFMLGYQLPVPRCRYDKPPTE